MMGKIHSLLLRLREPEFGWVNGIACQFGVSRTEAIRRAVNNYYFAVVPKAIARRRRRQRDKKEIMK